MALTWIRTHDWDAEDWRDRASCRDTSPELFFPIGTTGLALDQIDAAKQVCVECPVSSQCLEFALATNQEAGVWGGTTEDERRRLRKGLDVVAATGPATENFTISFDKGAKGCTLKLAWDTTVASVEIGTM